ncbi:polyunsaturated fatty acid lipoxygenase ALOX8 isoform 1-T2 [Spinachia spinachia]
MVNYQVIVSTTNAATAATFNNVYIKLVGTDGESDRTWLDKYKGALSFIRGADSSFTVSCSSIGMPVLIELNKQSPDIFPEDAWFPSKVEVKSPDGKTYMFPIHRWITDSEVYPFREAKALRVFEDDNNPGRSTRIKELRQRKKDYRWHEYLEGIPHCMKVESLLSLPYEIQFSFTKTSELIFTEFPALLELELTGLSNRKENWPDVHSIHKIFCCGQTQISDYVQENWREDEFFGYQFLNGVNPMMIQRCSALPGHFPVTKDMVYLGGQSLAHEMKKGNIFLCDYKCLDGLIPNVINGKKQYLMAPLVLLHKTSTDDLMPIAIQLKQIPSDDNPIFLPSDNFEWLMAKVFVRSADFHTHQLGSHLLRTHLLAEVFTVSLLRNLPMVHPLYKLIVPHTRYTIHINALARAFLISESGVFPQIAACGSVGIETLLKRLWSSVTYRSLCIPDDIADRGLEDVPNFYYREDGLRLWGIINRFVQAVLRFYYKNDAEVQEDSELQKWISDIFEHGFLSKTGTGIPQSFTSVADLEKFVTMVIFTCSGQHSAVNSGQFDFGGWMPNTPSSLQQPPPTTKGTASEATLLQTLPDINTTVKEMSTLRLLSRQSTDFVPLGQYPEKHFGEKQPCKLIKRFQADLKVLSADIKARNRNLMVPYPYLDPLVAENSVSL